MNVEQLLTIAECLLMKVKGSEEFLFIILVLCNIIFF
jgi:hypothetical protein